MKLRSKILFICLLALAPKAFAEKSCHSLFALVHPTDAEIERTFFEMKSLASQRYSKDSTESNIARSLYNEKLKQLEPFFTAKEIKAKLSSIQIGSRTETKINLPRPSQKETGDAILKVGEFLNENGFTDVNGINNRRYTPLDLAIENSKIHLVKPLIELGADVNKESPHFSLAPLITLMIMASSLKQEDFIFTLKTLLENKADTETPGFENTTALIKASRGIPDAVEILLKYKANPNARDEGGVTPLMAAALQGNKEIYEMLLKHNADPNLQDKNGNTPLILIAFYGHKDAAKLLIENGANIHLKDKDSKSALTHAIERGHQDVEQILRDAGATE